MSAAGFPLAAGPELRRALLLCCSSHTWLELMCAEAPFADEAALLAAARRAAARMVEADWIEAFRGHPMIGDVTSLGEAYRASKRWASAEQAGVQAADGEVLEQLARLNEAYAAKFGFIFIICATGKSASAMLEALQARIGLTREQEIANAAREQLAITELRLKKLVAATAESRSATQTNGEVVAHG